MATTSNRLQLVLPDDGGPGGDDVVDVTAQLSNSMVKLDDAVGSFPCTAATRPTSNNFNGRIINETDTGKTLMYYGGVWYAINGPMLNNAGLSAGVQMQTFTAITDINNAQTQVVCNDPGYYRIHAEMIVDFSTSASVRNTLFIARNDNTLVSQSLPIGINGTALLLAVAEGTLWVPTATTFKLRAQTTANNGVQNILGARLQMHPCAAPTP